MSGSYTPTEGHCPVTMDDRARLLPSSSSSFSSCAATAGGDDDVVTAAVAAAASSVTASETDAQAKSSIVDSSCEVYTITDAESLPSHMRSLLPAHEQHVHDLLTLERTRRRLRYVIVGLTAMLALTVVVAAALVLSIKVTPPLGSGMMGGGASHFRTPSFPLNGESQGVDLATQVKVSLLGEGGGPRYTDLRARYRHLGTKDPRAPCVTECWSYAAFRFRSTCQDGYCRCHGEDYDTYTCLPKYHGCNIQKRFPSQSAAKLFGKNKTTYVCHVPAPPSSRDVDVRAHVVSIFGNHRSPSTQVTVRNVPVGAGQVLVLVNYHLVQWTVHLPRHSAITKIVVVSMKRSNQAPHVLFSGPAKAPDVEVTHRLSLTGYGEDRNSGHTPQLLRFVEQQLGPIASFTGASHADEILLDLKDSMMTTAPSSTTTRMTSTTTLKTVESAASTDPPSAAAAAKKTTFRVPLFMLK
ncbi:uncharacterized protein LOC143287303 [Babylonia areolata]|uniref:uncharacterized protein LOC143287303 n=1 Tax=Babylonia areolata TaxID=304850 RepID=UPI003FCF353D